MVSPNPTIPVDNKHRALGLMCCYWKWKWVLFLLLLLLLLLFVSVSVSDSSSIVHSLPGFAGSLPFKLETGYIGVDKEDVQLFYYFIESEGNPREDPLLLWLTGGPGCSALSGLLFEIGPLSFDTVNSNDSSPTLKLNPHSWTKISSIIFVDAPVGTGFSYSRSLRGSKSSDTKHAHHTLDFLIQWFGKHPEFLKNELYIAGDSYSGMIVPLIVWLISDGYRAEHKPLLNLKGYVLGNPVTDAKIDYNSRVPFAHHMALISDELYKSAKRNCKGLYVQVDPDNKKCIKDLQAISKCTEKINLGNVLDPICPSMFALANDMEDGQHRHLVEEYGKAPLLLPTDQIPEFDCSNYKLCRIWANDNNVQQALHVRKGTIRRLWKRCNPNLNYAYNVGSVVSYHSHFNRKGYRALIYSGDHDLKVPYLGTQAWIKLLNLTIVDEWRPWFVDGQVAGYTRKYSNDFTYATIKGGSHTPPDNRRKECLAMMGRWISEKLL